MPAEKRGPHRGYWCRTHESHSLTKDGYDRGECFWTGTFPCDIRKLYEEKKETKRGK